MQVLNFKVQILIELKLFINYQLASYLFYIFKLNIKLNTATYKSAMTTSFKRLFKRNFQELAIAKEVNVIIMLSFLYAKCYLSK